MKNKKEKLKIYEKELENLTQREKVFFNFLWNRFIKENPDEYTKITDLSYPLFTGYETNSRFSEIKKILGDEFILGRKSKGVNYWEYKIDIDRFDYSKIHHQVYQYGDGMVLYPSQKSILNALEIFSKIINE
jgi:hypothetical protein